MLPPSARHCTIYSTFIYHISTFTLTIYSMYLLVLGSLLSSIIIYFVIFESLMKKQLINQQKKLLFEKSNCSKRILLSLVHHFSLYRMLGCVLCGCGQQMIDDNIFVCSCIYMYLLFYTKSRVCIRISCIDVQCLDCTKTSSINAING